MRTSDTVRNAQAAPGPVTGRDQHEDDLEDLCLDCLVADGQPYVMHKLGIIVCEPTRKLDSEVGCGFGHASGMASFMCSDLPGRARPESQPLGSSSGALRPGFFSSLSLH
jgi:hypothetical protein